MPQMSIAGSRIRARRLDLGVRQGDLARQVGISAAYLNLIEHNRRRIAGRTLNALARELGVEAATLAEGADQQLTGALHDAVAQHGEPATGPAPEADRLAEFAGRFPGLAGVMLAQHRQIDALRALVDSLSDRLEHDPFLGESIHEVLTAATAISSTAEILAEAEGGDIEPLRRRRFTNNILSDSQRMAETARSLAGYLDGSGAQELHHSATPTDQMHEVLGAINWHVSALEAPGQAPDPATLARDIAPGTVPQVLGILESYLSLYADDAETLPAARLEQAVAAVGADPQALARLLDCPLPVLFHRIATCAPQGFARAGLSVADASGAILYRRPLEGFPAPHFGQGCPLQPLSQVQSTPATPQSARLRFASGDEFLAFGAVREHGRSGFDQPPLLRSYQLVMHLADAPHSLIERCGPARDTGANCRICAIRGCDARREPSLLRALS